MRKLLPLLILLVLWSCQSESRNARNPLKYVELTTPTGENIQTELVYSMDEQERGLSGTQANDFADDQGMLFFYLEDGDRSFWMPDTYFDLDLFFLDGELKVTDVIRKLPHYIGRANPERIPKARSVWSRHVLEMKASSELAQKLKVGDRLQWKSQVSLPQTESKIRQQQ